MDTSVAELTSATPVVAPATENTPAPVTQPVVAAPEQAVEPEPPTWLNQIGAPPAPPQAPYYPPPQYPQPQYRQPEMTYAKIDPADLIERPGEILSGMIGTSLEPLAQQLLAAQDRVARMESRVVNREIGRVRESLVSGFKNKVVKDPAYSNPEVKRNFETIVHQYVTEAAQVARNSGDTSMLEATHNPGFIDMAMYAAKTQAGYSGGETPRPLNAPMVEGARSAPATQSVQIDDDMRDALRQRGISEDAYVKAMETAKQQGFGY